MRTPVGEIVIRACGPSIVVRSLQLNEIAGDEAQPVRGDAISARAARLNRGDDEPGAASAFTSGDCTPGSVPDDVADFLMQPEIQIDENS